MLGKGAYSQMKPTGLGLTAQSSVYGTAIPLIYGRTRANLSLIWAENFKKHDHSTLFGLVDEPSTYTVNVDFLVGCNPIVTPLQMWANQNDNYLLGFPCLSVFRENNSSQDFTVDDEDFYAVIGVTIFTGYDETFNDYGGPGARHLYGSHEIPLWNMATAGPDCINESAYQKFPYAYFWKPGSPDLKIPGIELGLFPPSFVVKIYYAQFVDHASSKAGGGGVSPAAKLGLEWEAKLGTGSEFDSVVVVPFPPGSVSSPDWEAQRKLYPPYAGLGGNNLDLGTGTALPSIRAEFLGSFPLYSEGDCDFADIIEDIFKSGLAQAGYGESPAYTQLQRGLGCYEFPGTVQKIQRYAADAGLTPIKTIPFGRPNLAGNIMVVAASARSGWSSAATLSDVGAHTWVPVVTDQRAKQRQLWYVADISETLENILSLNIDGADGDVLAFEIGGVDTLDGAPVLMQSDGTERTSISASITTTNGAFYYPTYVLSWLFCEDQAVLRDMKPRGPLKELVASREGSYQRADYCAMRYPGAYEFAYDYQGELSGIPDDVEWTWVLIAFKATAVPNYAKPLGDILDAASLEQCRLQCRANGIWGSLCMDSQKKASDWLADYYFCMNAAPVWSGFKLKSIPYSEVSAVGNGATFIAPTADGPVADLGENDFIADPGQPVITVNRKARVDSPSLMQVQHPNRANQYNDVVVSQAEKDVITVFGLRKDSPRVIKAIQNSDIAGKILNIMLRRENVLRCTYKFKVKANWKLLEAMDLVTITDLQMGIDHVPVRMTSIDEDENFALDCEAEPFVYGTMSPTDVAVPTPDPYIPITDIVPALVNAPLFLVTKDGLARLNVYGSNEIWAAISDGDPAYGGCFVHVSYDGGTSYMNLGYAKGSANVGVVVSDPWPSGTDPDTTNDLMVDLTESLGMLPSYSVPIEDSLFLSPCFVEGGTPYEIISYAAEEMTAPYKYTIKATGGNKIRRGIFTTPIGEHAKGSRFAWLPHPNVFNNNGLFIMLLDPQWIGQTLYFKFQAFNKFGGGLQSLSDCVAYPFVPYST